MRRAGPSTLASAALVNFAVAHWRPRRPPSSMSELHNSPEPIAYNYRVVRQFTLIRWSGACSAWGSGCSSPRSWYGPS